MNVTSHPNLRTNNMGYMSDLDAEKADTLRDAHWEYEEAFAAYQSYMDQHPPAHRKPDERQELGRLESICMAKKYAYENAKAERFRV